MGTRKREALLVFSVNRYQLFVRGMTTEEEAKAGSYLLKKNYSPEMGDLKTSDNKSVDLRPVLCCSLMGDVLFLSRARSDSIARCLCVSAEQFQEARLVKITHWGLATWLDPLGMLEPQVVVNLFAELGTSTNLVRRDRRVVEIFDYVVRCAHVLKIGRRAHGANPRGFLA